MTWGRSTAYPATGWIAWQDDVGRPLVYSQNAWCLLADQLGPTAHLGINSTADDTNRLSLSSHAALFDHAGTDHRLHLNKATATDTSSLVLQTNYSGRAEIGLSGSDNMSVKVSTDGSVWRDALEVEAATGTVNAPAGLKRNGHTVLDTNNTPDILSMKGNIGPEKDLNDYQSTGLWFQTANYYAIIGQNHPVGFAGLLTIVAAPPVIFQTYRVYPEPAEVGDATFTRSFYNGVWSPWRQLAFT